MVKLTRNEQKDKWLSIHKKSQLKDILEAQPKDYQERNTIYKSLCSFLGYPLQLLSMAAGAYLLYDLVYFVWRIHSHTIRGRLIFFLCFTLFLAIEGLRRWLINTTGYNYFASLRISQGYLKKGEWIRSNIIALISLSIILVSTGTAGVYQYIKRNSPQVTLRKTPGPTKDLITKIGKERKEITKLDRLIEGLILSKKEELKKPQHQLQWQGKSYLLPEVKVRHQAYDQQIEAFNQQRQNHQALLSQYEKERNQREQKIEKQNESLVLLHNHQKESYALITAGVWFLFEIILVFLLAYPWIYRYQIKKEKLIEQAEKDTEITPPGRLADNIETKTTVPQNNKSNPSKTIGFDKWYEKNTFTSASKPQSVEGFTVTCRYCGTYKIKKRPAKYCGNACRYRAWKEKRKAFGQN